MAKLLLFRKPFIAKRNVVAAKGRLDLGCPAHLLQGGCIHFLSLPRTKLGGASGSLVL